MASFLLDSDLPKPTRQHWLVDEITSVCMNEECKVTFTMIQRKHHCRRCGKIFCHNCTRYRVRLDGKAAVSPTGRSSKVCRLCCSLKNDLPQDIERVNDLQRAAYNFRKVHCFSNKNRLQNIAFLVPFNKKEAHHRRTRSDQVFGIKQTGTKTFQTTSEGTIESNPSSVRSEGIAYKNELHNSNTKINHTSSSSSSNLTTSGNNQKQSFEEDIFHTNELPYRTLHEDVYPEDEADDMRSRNQRSDTITDGGAPFTPPSGWSWSSF